jgi:prolyl-tRNA synthetase
LIVVDDAIVFSPNLVAGANEDGFHLLNVNYGRDYQADIVTDITAARAGDRSPDDLGVLREVRGVELGHIFKLGTRYSQVMGATFLDKEGEKKPVIMGSYGIGIGRLMACIAEEHHDDNGLMWPITVAPFQVQLVTITDADAVKTTADRLYTDLWNAGVEVLYDDRSERPGVKFNDADIIGVPLRLTVSQRSIEAGGVEFKRRDEAAVTLLPLDQVIEQVLSAIRLLSEAITATLKPEPLD